jgi:bifunctional UDP-N-acetylglucosamine pyrophosphorylase/glucosamine-1-phosphate N-acetyltransferase
VLDTARSLSASRLCVIYGHGGAAVQALLAKQPQPVATALQEKQLGTGHAVMQGLPELDDNVPTLILYGDVPLTTAASLQALIAAAGNDKLGILTVEQDDPTGLGRIVRENGHIVRIVEQKDATEAERAIKEINSGIMVAPTKRLKQWLGAIKNDNAQGEYYLTDIVALAVADGVPVVSAQPSAVGSRWRQQQGAAGRAGAHPPAQHRQPLLEQGVT